MCMSGVVVNLYQLSTCVVDPCLFSRVNVLDGWQVALLEEARDLDDGFVKDDQLCLVIDAAVKGVSAVILKATIVDHQVVVVIVVVEPRSPPQDWVLLLDCHSFVLESFSSYETIKGKMDKKKIWEVEVKKNEQ